MTSTDLWEKVHRSRQWGTCPEPAVARWAMRRWGGQGRDAMGTVRLLEVGCGVGAQSVWLGNHGFLVDAFDVPAAIDRAYQMMPNHLYHSVKFWKARLPDLSLSGLHQGDKYDGVVDAGCLQHVDELDESLALMWRVLKPRGQLLSIFASSTHSYDLGDDLKGMTFHRKTIVEMMRLFENGWNVKAIESMNHTDRGKLISHWVVEAEK